MLLTIDIGTSFFKSALWNQDSFLKPYAPDKGSGYLSFASVPLTIKESDGIMHTADPGKWLDAFSDCLKRLLSGSRLNNFSSVEAIIISGNGPSLVPVLGGPVFSNKIFIPAQDARLWLDRRSVKYQAQVSEVMGGFVDASFFLPKILYIRKEETELFNKTKYFLGCPEYLAYALTDQACSVFPCEGFDRWFWNDNILEKLDLDKSKFPGFIRPGDLFGTITQKASDYYGFEKNIPVISGGPDFFAAILGCGVIRPGQACDRSGSSEGINLCTENKIDDQRLMSYRHPVNPYWNLSGIINTTGKAVEWGCSFLGFSCFDEFISSAQRSSRGSKGIVFLPYLAGERAPLWDPSARALWKGLSLSSGRSEAANSVLEGIGFAVKDVIKTMEENGECAHELRVTGRLALCEPLNQIKADITGKETLVCACKEAELLGLAITGACALGKYASFAEAACEMVRVEKHYEPDPENAGIYSRLFDEYKHFQNKKNMM